MAYIEWKNDYNINIGTIDAQHQVLINIINELHDNISPDISLSEKAHKMSIILTELVLYTKSHFKFEEKLLSSLNYPAKTVHRVMHEGFTKEIIELQKNLESGQLVLTVQVITFLKEWLIKHILVEDKKYAFFYANKKKIA